MSTVSEKTNASQKNVKLSRRRFLSIGAATAAVTVASGAGMSAIAATLKPKMSTPTLQVVSATQVSLSLQVCAGATGAPAGFSVQWMTAADYASNGNQWFLSDDLRLCKASFSGNANLSRYNLAAGECVTVNIGDFLNDNGASTNCAHELKCGTEYIFRAFVHADNTRMRSDFTGNVSCSTLDCGTSGGGCTYTQGYWEAHGPRPSGNNTNEWPALVQLQGLVLGTIQYTQDQLQDIFEMSVGGNGLISLAHQLIAAKLNIANGADSTAIGTAISQADALISGLSVPPVGSGYLAPSVTSSLVTQLTTYNEGGTGPGHCN